MEVEIKKTSFHHRDLNHVFLKTYSIFSIENRLKRMGIEGRAVFHTRLDKIW